MGKQLRAVRRAGILALAAMAVTGCSLGGGSGATSESSAEEAAEAEQGTTAAEGETVADAEDSTGSDGEDEEGAEAPVGAVGFSEEAAVAAVEAAVPTSSVKTSEEVYAALEETVEQLEELESTDTCMALSLEGYRYRLAERTPTVQGDVADEALLEPGAFESLSVATVVDEEASKKYNEGMRENCLEEGDELSVEESTLGDCDVVEEQYTRGEDVTRRTVAMTCTGVLITYNSLKTEPAEGEFEPWREEAVARVAAVAEQLSS